FSDDFFNTWVLSSADGSKVGVGGSLAITLYNNTAHAIIESGSTINAQSVEVHAGTKLELLEVAGMPSLNINPEGALSALKAKSLSERLGKLVNPIGVSGEKGGIGASFLFDKIDNSTVAEVQDGVFINAGGGLKIEATQTTFSFALAQSGAKASGF